MTTTLEGRLTMPVIRATRGKRMSDLDAILNGEEIEPTEAVETVEEVEEPKGEEPEVETEPEAAEDKPEESTPDPKKAEDTSWQFEAYKDEKRKRQELERQIQELKQPKEPEKAPDVFENQEAYTDYIQSQIQQNSLAMRAEMSQFHAQREFGKDVVDQKLSQFREMVAKDPSLAAKVQSSSSPVYEAIDIVDKAEKLAQLENVDSIEAKIRQEVEDKIRAEYEHKYSTKAEKRSSVTPSLNNQASSQSAKVDDDSLSAILGGR